MSGNSFGKLFTLTTAGESHGNALLGIVDGCPPGMKLSEEDLQGDLDLRKPGSSRHTTQRRESDAVKIVSGTFGGVTTGTPIGLLIENNDQRPRDYTKIANSFRPGHADFSYQQKYGIRDYRGGGRSSARETAIRVAAGGIAKKYLSEKFGIQIRGYLAQLGPISFEKFDWGEVHNNPFFCPDYNKVPELEEYMDNLRKSGDSIGARIDIVASNMVTGLGEPIFDRLDADIAHAMMSINAVKGIEIGADAYVTKPFNMQVLKSQIKQLISSREILFNKYFKGIKNTDLSLQTSRDKQFITSVLNYINNNINNPNLSVESLADELFLSRSKLYRKIKFLTGDTATEFIRKIKLEKAKELLNTTDLTVSEISYKVGFSSPSYFTKCFKLHFGKIPKEYRFKNIN